eukprot:gene5696-6683_t
MCVATGCASESGAKSQRTIRRPTRIELLDDLIKLIDPHSQSSSPMPLPLPLAFGSAETVAAEAVTLSTPSLGHGSGSELMFARSGQFNWRATECSLSTETQIETGTGHWQGVLFEIEASASAAVEIRGFTIGTNASSAAIYASCGPLRKEDETNPASWTLVGQIDNTDERRHDSWRVSLYGTIRPVVIRASERCSFCIRAVDYESSIRLDDARDSDGSHSGRSPQNADIKLIHGGLSEGKDAFTEPTEDEWSSRVLPAGAVHYVVESPMLTDLSPLAFAGASEEGVSGTADAVNDLVSGVDARCEWLVEEDESDSSLILMHEQSGMVVEISCKDSNGWFRIDDLCGASICNARQAPQVKAAKEYRGFRMRDNNPRAFGSKKTPVGEDMCLYGLKVVITGIMESTPREMLKDLLEMYGAELMTHVSRKTHYAIVGRNAGPRKLEMIKKHKTKVLDEDGLFELINLRKRPAGAPMKGKKKTATSTGGTGAERNGSDDADGGRHWEAMQYVVGAKDGLKGRQASMRNTPAAFQRMLDKRCTVFDYLASAAECNSSRSAMLPMKGRWSMKTDATNNGIGDGDGNAFSLTNLFSTDDKIVFGADRFSIGKHVWMLKLTPPAKKVNLVAAVTAPKLLALMLEYQKRERGSQASLSLFPSSSPGSVANLPLPSMAELEQHWRTVEGQPTVQPAATGTSMILEAGTDLSGDICDVFKLQPSAVEERKAEAECNSEAQDGCASAYVLASVPIAFAATNLKRYSVTCQLEAAAKTAVPFSQASLITVHDDIAKNKVVLEGLVSSVVGGGGLESLQGLDEKEQKAMLKTYNQKTKSAKDLNRGLNTARQLYALRHSRRSQLPELLDAYNRETASENNLTWMKKQLRFLCRKAGISMLAELVEDCGGLEVLKGNKPLQEWLLVQYNDQVSEASAEGKSFKWLKKTLNRLTREAKESDSSGGEGGGGCGGGGGSSTPSSATRELLATTPLLEPNVAVMVDMGFSMVDAETALAMTNGNLERAVDLCLLGHLPSRVPSGNVQRAAAESNGGGGGGGSARIPGGGGGSGSTSSGGTAPSTTSTGPQFLRVVEPECFVYSKPSESAQLLATLKYGAIVVNLGNSQTAKAEKTPAPPEYEASKTSSKRRLNSLLQPEASRHHSHGVFFNVQADCTSKWVTSITAGGVCIDGSGRQEAQIYASKMPLDEPVRTSDENDTMDLWEEVGEFEWDETSAGKAIHVKLAKPVYVAEGKQRGFFIHSRGGHICLTGRISGSSNSIKDGELTLLAVRHSCTNNPRSDIHARMHIIRGPGHGPELFAGHLQYCVAATAPQTAWTRVSIPSIVNSRALWVATAIDGRELLEPVIDDDGNDDGNSNFGVMRMGRIFLPPSSNVKIHWSGRLFGSLEGAAAYDSKILDESHVNLVSPFSPPLLFGAEYTFAFRFQPEEGFLVECALKSPEYRPGSGTVVHATPVKDCPSAAPPLVVPTATHVAVAVPNVPSSVKVVLDRTNGRRLGIRLGNSLSIDAGIPVTAVDVDGQAFGQLEVGDVIRSVHGHSMLGLSMGEAAMCMLEKLIVHIERELRDSEREETGDPPDSTSASASASASAAAAAAASASAACKEETRTSMVDAEVSDDLPASFEYPYDTGIVIKDDATEAVICGLLPFTPYIFSVVRLRVGSGNGHSCAVEDYESSVVCWAPDETLPTPDVELGSTNNQAIVSTFGPFSSPAFPSTGFREMFEKGTIAAGAVLVFKPQIIRRDTTAAVTSLPSYLTPGSTVVFVKDDGVAPASSGEDGRLEDVATLQASAGIIVLDIVTTADHPTLGVQFTLPANTANGITVGAVDNMGNAARAGVEVGDIVLAVGANDMRGKSVQQVAMCILGLASPIRLTIRPANRCVVKSEESGELLHLKYGDLGFPTPVFIARGSEGTPKQQIVQLVSQMTDRNPNTITELVFSECRKKDCHGSKSDVAVSIKTIAKLFVEGHKTLRAFVYKAVELLDRSEQQQLEPPQRSFWSHSINETGKQPEEGETAASSRYSLQVPVCVGSQYEFKVQYGFALKVHAFQRSSTLTPTALNRSGGGGALSASFDEQVTATGVFASVTFPKIHGTSSNPRGLSLLVDGKIDSAWSSLGSSFPHWVKLDAPPSGRQLVMQERSRWNKGAPSKLLVRACNDRTGTLRVVREISLLSNYERSAAVALLNHAELQPGEKELVVEIHAVHGEGGLQGTRQATINGFMFAPYALNSGRRDETLPKSLRLYMHPAKPICLASEACSITIGAQPPSSPTDAAFSSYNSNHDTVAFSNEHICSSAGSPTGKHQLKLPLPPPLTMYQARVFAFNECGDSEPSQCAQWSRYGVVVILAPSKSAIVQLNQQVVDDATSAQLKQQQVDEESRADGFGTVRELIDMKIESMALLLEEEETPRKGTVDAVLAAIMADGPVLAGLVRRAPTFCNGVDFAASPAEKAAVGEWKYRASLCNAKAKQLSFALIWSVADQQMREYPEGEKQDSYESLSYQVHKGNMQAIIEEIPSLVDEVLLPLHSMVLDNNSTQGGLQHSTLLHIVAGQFWTGTDELEYLLRCRKRADAVRKYIGCSLCIADANGRTPLLVAAASQNLEACDLLIKVLIQRFASEKETIRKVIQGADKLGNTTLHYLFMVDVGPTTAHSARIKLVARYSDLTLENDQSENALVHALKYGQVIMVHSVLLDLMKSGGLTKETLAITDGAGNNLLHLTALNLMLAIGIVVDDDEYDISLRPSTQDAAGLLATAGVCEVVIWLKNVAGQSLIAAKNDAGWTASAMVLSIVSSRRHLTAADEFLELCFWKDEPSLLACLDVGPLLPNTLFKLLQSTGLCSTFLQNLAPLAKEAPSKVQPLVKATARIYSTCIASNLSIDAKTVLTGESLVLKANIEAIFAQFPELAVLELGECARAYVSPLLKHTVPDVQVPSMGFGAAGAASREAGTIEIPSEFTLDSSSVVDFWQSSNESVLEVNAVFVGSASVEYIVELIRAGNSAALKNALTARKLVSDNPLPPTLLHAAALQRHAKIAWLLVNFGGRKSSSKHLDLNATDSAGNTALSIATSICNLPVMSLLLQQEGLNPDASARSDGATPLHVACAYSSTYVEDPRNTMWNPSAMVRLLLQGGCDPSIRNSDGKRAIDLAEEHNTVPECVGLLQIWPMSSSASMAASIESSRTAPAELFDARRMLKVAERKRQRADAVPVSKRYTRTNSAVIDHRPTCKSDKHIFDTHRPKMYLARSNNDDEGGGDEAHALPESSFTCGLCAATREWHATAMPPQRWRCTVCGDQLCATCSKLRGDFGTWSSCIRNRTSTGAGGHGTIPMDVKIAVATSRLLKEQVAVLATCKERAEPMVELTACHEIFLATNSELLGHVCLEMDHLERQLSEGQTLDAHAEHMNPSAFSDMYMASLLDRHDSAEADGAPPFVDLSGYGVLALLADALMLCLPSLQLEAELTPPTAAAQTSAGGGVGVMVEATSPFFLRSNAATDAPNYDDAAADGCAAGTTVSFDAPVDATLPLATNPHLLAADRSIMFGRSGGGAGTGEWGLEDIHDLAGLPPSARLSASGISSMSSAARRYFDAVSCSSDNAGADDQQHDDNAGAGTGIAAELAFVAQEASAANVPLISVFQKKWATSLRMLSTEFMKYFAYGERAGHFKQVLRASLSTEKKESLFSSILASHPMWNKHRTYFVGPNTIEREGIVASSAERIDLEISARQFPFRLDGVAFAREQGSGPGVTRGWWTAVVDALSAPSAVFAASLAQSRASITLVSFGGPGGSGGGGSRKRGAVQAGRTEQLQEDESSRVEVGVQHACSIRLLGLPMIPSINPIKVVWIGEPPKLTKPAADETVTFVSVDESVGGICVLSNGGRFSNPANPLSLSCPVRYTGDSREPDAQDASPAPMPPLRWLSASPEVRIAPGGLGVATDSAVLSGAALSNLGFTSGIHCFEANIRWHLRLETVFGVASPDISLHAAPMLAEGTWVWNLGDRFAASGQVREEDLVMPEVANAGDKVSCIVDLDAGILSFRLNKGEPVIATSNLPIGQGAMYCPYVKLGNTNALTGLKLVSSTTQPVLARVTSARAGAGRQLFHEPGHAGVYAPCYIPDEDEWVGGEIAAGYRFVGRFVGLALFNRVRIGLRLSRHVIKYMLRLPLHWNDLAFYSTSTFEKFRRMINDPDEWVLPELLDFTIDLRGLGGLAPVELKPGGKSIEVTPANVVEYVELSARALMELSTLRALEELRAGFEEVFDAGTFDLFTAEDFTVLLNGSPTVDVAVLKAHTRVHGGSMRFRGIFWEVLEIRFSSADRSRLLSFWTGSATVPSNLADFALHLTVQTGPGIHAHSSRLPSASTCSSQMSLPEYATADMLERRLRAALQELSYQLS